MRTRIGDNIDLCVALLQSDIGLSSNSAYQGPQSFANCDIYSLLAFLKVIMVYARSNGIYLYLSTKKHLPLNKHRPRISAVAKLFLRLINIAAFIHICK